MRAMNIALGFGIPLALSNGWPRAQRYFKPQNETQAQFNPPNPMRLLESGGAYLRLNKMNDRVEAWEV
jgi:hypothetical protein